MHSCPALRCPKKFPTFKALSAHQARCKFMPETVTAAARLYAEHGEGAGARKRQRMSLSPRAGDEELGDTEAADFEVCCYCDVSVFIY
jgi:hypothetical protein